MLGAHHCDPETALVFELLRGVVPAARRTSPLRHVLPENDGSRSDKVLVRMLTLRGVDNGSDAICLLPMSSLVYQVR